MIVIAPGMGELGIRLQTPTCTFTCPFTCTFTFPPPQAFWVFTVSLPAIFVNAPGTGELGIPFWQPGDIVGFVLWLIGMFFETTADFQKFFFKNNPENRGKWCAVGKWHQCQLGLCWQGSTLTFSTTYPSGKYKAKTGCPKENCTCPMC
jgi:hypothetical protein